jgi:hypothetical protein
MRLKRKDFAIANMQSSSYRQGGFSTVAAVVAIIILGIAFFTVFLLATSGGTKDSPSNQDNSQQPEEESSGNEPPYIRIPESSKVFQNDTYGFSFAYPDSFGELKVNNTASQGDGFRADSALATQKPVGSGTAFMTGSLSVLVNKKADFKVTVNSDDVSVAPTKTGNDITWKIVSRGNSNQDISVGKAYDVKSVKSQTGIPVFDFTYRPAGSLALGRWVFASGDNYIMIAMPSVSKPSGENLTESDVSAYTIIGNNIAKTVRVPDANADVDNSSTDDDSTN